MNDSLLFKQMMENVTESVYFKDLDSRFIAINKALAEKFGLDDPEEAVGKTDFDFFGDEHARAALEDEHEILKTKKPILNKVEKEDFRDSEQERWSSTSKFPLFNEQGELIGTYGISKDITLEKRYQERLKKSYDDFNKFSEQAPGLFYVFKQDPDGNTCLPFASRAINEIFELQPEDVEHSLKPIISRIHKADLRRTIMSVYIAVKKLRQWNHEFRMHLPGKGLRWVRGRAKPEMQPDGSVVGYGYVTDITHLKKANAENKRLRLQFQAILDTVPNLIFVKDYNGRFTMVNKAAAEFFGMSEEEMIGKNDIDLGVPEDRARVFIERDQRVIDEGKVELIDEDATTLPDGTEVWHQTIKVPFVQVDTHKKAALSIVTDITLRKNKENELNETLGIIGDQNKRLKNFAHIVSHNLRNHAGNISMLLSLYNSEETEEEREDLMDYLNQASERLNETIIDLNEIIDQQYKEADTLKEVNLGKTIGKIKEILTTEILKEQVSFVEDIDDSLCFTYNPAYLESIILNMLSNAIKYRHPDRKPEIRIKAYSEEGHYYLEIADNGLGIDMERNRDKLFGMYKTFHSNENSKGIGLFITRNQVESMGGTIEVESEVNKGTTFKIKLK